MLITHLRRRTLIACALAASALAATPGHAQTYPVKPITLVVSYPVGGDTDAMARLYAEKLSARVGQPVIVENRPGASGTIGDERVSRAAPDGYTLLFTPNTFPIAPLVLPRNATHHDVLKDFTPVIQTGSQAVLLVTSPASGLTSVKDLVTAAKSGSKTLSYGTPGAGSPMHIAAEMFDKAAGIQIPHVPYRGVAPVVNDLLGGHIAVGYVTLGPVAGHFALGKLLPLAVTDPQRSPLLPNVPTLSELGYPAAVGAWHGVLGPKGMPDGVVRLLNQHFNAILKMPDVVAPMATFGAVPAGGDSAAFGKLIADDYARFGKVIQEFGIRAE